MRFRPKFTLRTLLLLTALLAAPIAWQAHRNRVLHAERARLAGEWRIGDAVHGLQVQVSGDGIELGMPHDGIGEIDFHMRLGGGVSKGIYRIQGETIEVAQNNPGKPRPTDFDRKNADSVWSARRPTVPRLQPDVEEIGP